MEITNKILDMIAEWPASGQGFFFLVMSAMVLLAPISLILGIFKYVVVFFRGWPSKNEN